MVTTNNQALQVSLSTHGHQVGVTDAAAVSELCKLTTLEAEEAQEAVGELCSHQEVITSLNPAHDFVEAQRALLSIGIDAVAV